MINLTAMVNKIKSHPRYSEVGMIVSHTGVVRGTSRDGRPVSALEVKFDWDLLKKVIADYKQRPGIVEIMVEANQGTLNIGDEIMTVVVAGDIRENVFPVLQEFVDSIKRDVARKKEYFV